MTSDVQKHTGAERVCCKALTSSFRLILDCKSHSLRAIGKDMLTFVTGRVNDTAMGPAQLPFG